MANLSNRTVVIVGFVVIIIGVFLISYDYLAGKKNKAYEKINISLYSENDGVVVDNTPQNIAIAGVEVDDNNKNKNYLGVLKIDKISLEKGFYDKDNELNNVDKSVTL